MSYRTAYLTALDLIRSGITNSRAIALHLGLSISHTDIILTDLSRDGLIRQTRLNGNSISYASA